MNKQLEEAVTGLDANILEEIERLIGPVSRMTAKQLAEVILEHEPDWNLMVPCLWLLSFFRADRLKVEILAKYLGRARDRELASQLSRLAVSMKQPPVEMLAPFLAKHHHVETRLAAIYALGYSSSKAAMPWLLEIARDQGESPECREFAIEALGVLGFTEAVAGLRDLVSEADPALNFWVAYALGEIGSLSGLEVLESLLADHRRIRGMPSVAEEAADSIEIIRRRNGSG